MKNSSINLNAYIYGEVCKDLIYETSKYGVELLTFHMLLLMHANHKMATN